MADTEDDNSNDCPLHKCVFENDYRRLGLLLRTYDIAKKDKHGNISRLCPLSLFRKQTGFSLSQTLGLLVEQCLHSYLGSFVLELFIDLFAFELFIDSLACNASENR